MRMLNLLLVAGMAIGLSATAVLAEDAPVPAPAEGENPAAEAQDGKGKEGEGKKEDDKSQLPPNDPKAQDELKKAYDAIYSARRAGLEKFFAKTKFALKFPNAGAQGGGSPLPGMGDISLTGKVAWTKEGGIKLSLDEDAAGAAAQNPFIGQVRQVFRQQAERFEEFIVYLIGFPKFEDNFKDSAFTFSKNDDPKSKAKLVKVSKLEDGSVKETVYTIEKGQITAREVGTDGTGDFDTYTYEKKGRDLFFQTISREGQQNLQGQAVDAKMDFTVNEREKFGNYTIGTKLSTKVDFTMIQAEIELTLSGTKVDKDVTDEMIKQAEGAAAEAPEGGEAPKKEGADDF